MLISSGDNEGKGYGVLLAATDTESNQINGKMQIKLALSQEPRGEGRW